MKTQMVELTSEQWDHVMGALRVAARLAQTRDDKADASIWITLREKIAIQRGEG